MLSVFSSVYKFIWSYPHKKRVTVWESVRQELRAAVSLAPLIPVNLSTPWSEQVFCTDASWLGQGVTTRKMDRNDVKAAAKVSEGRGWVLEAEAEFLATELSEQSDPAAEMGCVPFVSLRENTAFARPTRVSLHLYSGRRRMGDLQHYLDLRSDLAYDLHVVSLDVQVNPRTGDMTDTRKVDHWVTTVQRGIAVGMHAGPPCSTWSQARWNRNFPGPGPARSEEAPWGLPELLPHEDASVQLGNLLLLASLRLAEALFICGVFGLSSTPKTQVPDSRPSSNSPKWNIS